MPVTFNKRNKEKARQERQAEKRVRRDERRVKRNQPAAPEDASLIEGEAFVDGESPATDELSGPRATEIAEPADGPRAEAATSG
jgi:hypothetical protein